MSMPTKELEQVSVGGRVVIESAHFYAEGGLDSLALLGAQIAIDLANVMTGWGTQVEHMLFVDDIGNIGVEPDIAHELAVLAEHEYYPFWVVYESSLVGAGQALIDQLVQGGKTKEHNGRLKLKYGFFPIEGKAGKSDHPSCEVLDAVLYTQKLQTATGAVTVLPESYFEQQTKTRKILQAVGVLTPRVLVVCHDHHGSITKTQYWGE